MKLLKFKNTFLILALITFSTFSLFADETYKVQKGDTLYSISRKFQITVAELRAANNLSENDVLKADQKLIIPTADISTAAALTATYTNKTSQNVKTTVYTVEKGDTLYGIARKNGMTVAELLALNNLDSSAVIKVGQKLKIKDVSAGTTTPVVKAAEPKKAETTDTKSKTETKTESKKSETIVINTNTVTDETPDTRTYGVTINTSTTVWPLKNPTVTQVKGKVSGVQLSGKTNETVTCIHEGTVMFVGTYRGFGQVLFVQSKTGLIYAYTGMGSVGVKKGDYVISGADLGTCGQDAISGKYQITFMVFQNGQPIDPAKAPRN